MIAYYKDEPDEQQSNTSISGYTDEYSDDDYDWCNPSGRYHSCYDEYDYINENHYKGG